MTQMQDLLFSFSHARPELLLAAFALLAVLVGAWFGERAFAPIANVGVAVLIAAGALAILDRPQAPLEIFQGEFVIDGIGVFAKALIAFSAAATLWLGADHFTRTNERRFEFPVLNVLAVLGMFIMVSARDLITLYIGVELQSLAA